MGSYPRSNNWAVVNCLRVVAGVAALASAGCTPVAPMPSIFADRIASNAAICLFDSTITLIVVLSFVAASARLLSAVLMPSSGHCAVTALELPKITALPKGPVLPVDACNRSRAV